MLWVLLLLLPAQVVTTPVTKCDGNKYALGRLCCDLCPPGECQDMFLSLHYLGPLPTPPVLCTALGLCEQGVCVLTQQGLVGGSGPGISPERSQEAGVGTAHGTGHQVLGDLLPQRPQGPGRVCALGPSSPLSHPPTGHHVSADCTESQATRCSPCPPGTFMAHDNRKTQCQTCAKCRDDQEVVKNCTPTSDQQCQCKTGQCYCDSENCPEMCYPCTRCPGATRHPCTATRDTVCATEPSPAPGNLTRNPVATDSGLLVGFPWGTVINFIVIAIGIAIGIAIVIGLICCYGGKQARSGEPSSHVRSRESVQPNEDPESGPPAPGVETTPLMEEGGSALAPAARPCPGPSDDPGEAVELMVMSRGSPTTPELSPRAVPDAHRSLSWASLRRLEQSRESVQPNEDPESGPPAPGVETTPLMEEGGSALAPGARPCPGPSDDPGEAVELMVMSRGSKTTPELSPRAVPDAHRSLSWASLRRLEQEYKQKYILKDESYDAINTLYHEFRQKLPEHDWKIFMNFVGTEENGAEVCDHDNPGTLMEPHHQITVCLKEDTGRVVFRLMAVLHQRGLHEPLQNIINMLIAENIIGSHAETPN
ncbi:uncharacterized protein LOC118643128 [Molossus molossus]|uniref:uncharacterized protein LOC118643128 n=1 Tax=Molossus molossus TaxID=27622 RepID=UPI001745EC68|nr:uncharacterized protein LOC118643128 [Molossus molossus]